MRSRVAAIVGNATYSELVTHIPDGLRGSQLVLDGYAEYRSRYNTSSPGMRATNGAVFECLILEALLAEDVSPAYYQASVEHVPNVVFDIFLYHRKTPVVLSCKTSLRERWKQAHVEGIVLKQVYGGATSVLLTLSNEGYGVQEKIRALEVHGLDACIVIAPGRSEFDTLLERLRDYAVTTAEPVLPVEGRVVGSE